jgi:hypothetical protein
MTTIKVDAPTRDRIRTLGDEWHLTADQVVVRALDELDRQRRRHRAYEQARALVLDEADRAEARAILRDMDDLRAW